MVQKEADRKSTEGGRHVIEAEMLVQRQLLTD